MSRSYAHREPCPKIDSKRRHELKRRDQYVIMHFINVINVTLAWPSVDPSVGLLAGPQGKGCLGRPGTSLMLDCE